MKAAMLACWLFCGLVLVENGALAQEPGQEVRRYAEAKQVDVEISEQLLIDAEALMQAGKPGEAYLLLEPLEFDRAGEVRFDYLIGIAALDSGKPDKATLAFERVLAVDPDHAGARLDMARAYYQLGDMARARTEFETLRQQNPSAAVHVTIQKYLDSMAGLETGKVTRISGYVAGVIGWDSNVSNAADQSRVATGSIVTTLNSTNMEMADKYYGVAVGSEIYHSLNANWGLYAGADLRQRGNKTQKSFDALSLDGRVGVTYGAGDGKFRVGALGGQHSLGGSRDRNTSGLNAEWRYAIDQRDQVNVFGQYVEYRYYDAAMQLNDINQQAAGVDWKHLLENSKSMLSASVYFGLENDVGPVTAGNLLGGRPDGARHFGGLRIGSQGALGENTKLFISAGGQMGTYSKVNPSILHQRTDRQYDLTLGVNWYWNHQWSVRPQLTHISNHSNVAQYSYDRTDVSLMLRRNFN